jgi:DNA-binding transcriptional LysR family regulator
MMPIEAMDIARLRAFQLVARYGSLRSAAAHLKLTIPAVSVKISRLEDDLGVKLFERLPNKLILTAAGARFLPNVDAIFEHAEHALVDLSSRRIVGRLSVSVGNDLSTFFAPPISRYVNENPGVELSLQIYRSDEAVAALLRGEIDVAIGVFPQCPPGLNREVVFKTTLAALIPREHALASRRRVKMRDLVGQALILPPGWTETRKLIDRDLVGSSVQIGRYLEVVNCATAKVFVEQGAGIAIVHSLCVSDEHSATIRRLDFGSQFGRIDFCAAYRKNAAKSAIVSGLLDELRGFGSNVGSGCSHAGRTMRG